jgi:hypothetical protein
MLTDGMMDEAYQRKEEMDPNDSDLEWLFEKHFDLQGLPSSMYPALANNKQVIRTMEEIMDMVQGHHADKIAFYQSPMKYYGLKEGDFI